MCCLVIQDKLLLLKTIRQFNQLYYSTRCHHIIIILVAFKNPPMSCSHHNTFRCMHSCKYRVGSKRDIFTTKAHLSLCQAACDGTAAHVCVVTEQVGGSLDPSWPETCYDLYQLPPQPASRQWKNHKVRVNSPLCVWSVECPCEVPTESYKIRFELCKCLEK